MKIRLNIFGRRARRIGFFGLGASSLLAPARVMGGTTLAAAGLWAIVNFHPGSDDVHNLAQTAKPVYGRHALHQTQGQQGVAQLDATTIKLLMAANLNASGHGKGGSKTSNQPASGFQAAGFGSLGGGGFWPRSFGHRLSGPQAAARSNISPAASSNPPGTISPQQFTSPGPGPSAPPLHAPWHPTGSAPPAPTAAFVQPPALTLDHPVTPVGGIPPDTPPASDSGGPAGGPGLVLDPSGPPVHLGLVIEPGGPSFDLGLVVDPGDPVGDPVGLPGDPPALPPLPETLPPLIILASDLPLDPVAGPDVLGASALVSIPEPSSTGLLGIGLLGLAWARRKLGVAATSRF